jgi:hypothetical protein
MRRIFALTALVVLALLSLSTAVVGEKAINHNAVLICGDTPDLESQTERKTWNGGVNYQWTYDEFWNDTYLMWEIMWANECYNLHGAAPGSDHIQVLYGEGEDWSGKGFRYDPWEQQGIDEDITDYSAYYQDVANIFNWLAYGGGGHAPMTGQDNFFCWTFDHGDSGTVNGVYHSYLCLMDTPMRDDDFANRTDQISCKNKTFWMQQCFSGGFIDDLENSNTVILTAANSTEVAWRADNTSQYGSPLPENETYQSVTYHHGEFNFHTMNCVREEAIYPYDDPPKVNADRNRDLFITMDEDFHMANWWNTTSSHFQYSDLGDIGPFTVLGWDDYTPPAEPTNLECDSVTFVLEQQPVGLLDIEPLRKPPYALVWLSWDPNTEDDLVGYYIYRREAGGGWSRVGTSRSASYCDDADIGKTYWYYVTALDIAMNESGASNVIEVSTMAPRAGGTQTAGETYFTPSMLTISPNLIASRAKIQLDLPKESEVTLSFYNASGKLVDKLGSYKMEPGYHTITWKPKDLPSGIYFVRLNAGNITHKRKLILMR